MKCNLDIHFQILNELLWRVKVPCMQARLHRPYDIAIVYVVFCIRTTQPNIIEQRSANYLRKKTRLGVMHLKNQKRNELISNYFKNVHPNKIRGTTLGDLLFFLRRRPSLDCLASIAAMLAKATKTITHNSSINLPGRPCPPSIISFDRLPYPCFQTSWQ